MRVFVTGATGFIGSALVQELRGAGHAVVGLARSDAAAATLRAAGAAAHRGDIGDPESLAAGAAACDATVHLAFDAARMVGGLEALMQADRDAIQALTGALAGTGKPFVGTTGVMLLTPGKVAREQDPGDPSSAAGFRVPSEEAVLSAARRGVRASVVRLAPSVHGEGDAKGFMALFSAAARQTKASAYVGDGGNRWAAVHRRDAAALFRLVVEKGEAGCRYHGCGEDAIAFRDIAAAIGEAEGVPTRQVDPEGAAAHFGPLGGFAAVDNPVTSTWTRETLGWRPTGPGLIDDIRAGVYAAAARTPRQH